MLSWRDWYLKKKLKDQSINAQNRRSGEKVNNIYETYKNLVIPYGHQIYAKVYDMEKATMGAYPKSDNALPHRKCVLQCCYINVHVSILLTKKQIISIQTQHPQYGFTFITSLHVVLIMVELY